MTSHRMRQGALGGVVPIARSGFFGGSVVRQIRAPIVFLGHGHVAATVAGIHAAWLDHVGNAVETIRPSMDKDVPHDCFLVLGPGDAAAEADVRLERQALASSAGCCLVIQSITHLSRTLYIDAAARAKVRMLIYCAPACDVSSKVFRILFAHLSPDAILTAPLAHDVPAVAHRLRDIVHNY